MTRKEIFEFSKQKNCVLVESDFFNELTKKMNFGYMEIEDEELRSWWLRGNLVGFIYYDRQEHENLYFIKIYLGGQKWEKHTVL